jgi:hypothetical protein
VLEFQPMTNILWVAANIIFDLETGKKTEVLLLASREDDATTFKEEDAPTYLEFVKRRAPHIEWSKEGSKERPGMYVIKGVQNV